MKEIQEPKVLGFIIVQAITRPWTLNPFKQQQQQQVLRFSNDFQAGFKILLLLLLPWFCECKSQQPKPLLLACCEPFKEEDLQLSRHCRITDCNQAMIKWKIWQHLQENCLRWQWSSDLNVRNRSSKSGSGDVLYWMQQSRGGSGGGFQRSIKLSIKWSSRVKLWTLQIGFVAYVPNSPMYYCITPMVIYGHDIDKDNWCPYKP